MRAGLKASTLTLARQFLLDPEKYWGERAPRHVQKVTSGLRRALQPGERRVDLVEEILAIARLRTAHAPPPIYLSNAGSSGSHWLEAMLARAAGTHACGEVYLPRPVVAWLQEAEPADAAFLLHALYVAHSGRAGPAMVEGACVNSAHTTRVDDIAAFTPGARKILLLRHPADVVVSRTFRKAAHRADVAPEMGDGAYLTFNCETVERFHDGVAGIAFDAVVRYEDLVRTPEPALRDLLVALGLPADPECLRTAATSTSREAVQGARERGEKGATNLFAGEVAVDTSLRAAARERMAPLARKLGYDA